MCCAPAPLVPPPRGEPLREAMTAARVAIVVVGLGLLAWTLWDAWRAPTLGAKARAVLVPVLAALAGWFLG